MSRCPILVSFLFIVACDTSDQSARIAALENRVAALESAMASSQTILGDVQVKADAAADLRDRLDAAPIWIEDALVWIDAISAVTFVDEDGDVVVQGANLRVRKDQSTAGPPNGKGNVIIGAEYGQRLRCAGGANDGDVCAFGGDCPGGTCQELTGRDKSGSHNLIMGTTQSFSAEECIVTGANNAASANGVLILGGTGVVGNTAGDVIVAP